MLETLHLCRMEGSLLFVPFSSPFPPKSLLNGSGPISKP